MTNIQTIFHLLSGNLSAEALEALMAEQLPDFSQVQKNCADAMATLELDVGADAVTAEIESIKRQMASTFLFSGVLGIKANLDNFLDPVARNFLDTDPEIYLREVTARTLPEYREAEASRAKFFALLTPEQRALYEDVTAYAAYLETVGPKLAHYYGYLLGNWLLPKIIPGYHPDRAQTFSYRMMLKSFFAGAGEGLLSQCGLF